MSGSAAPGQLRTRALQQKSGGHRDAGRLSGLEVDHWLELDWPPRRDSSAEDRLDGAQVLELGSQLVACSI